MDLTVNIMNNEMIRVFYGVKSLKSYLNIEEKILWHSQVNILLYQYLKIKSFAYANKYAL